MKPSVRAAALASKPFSRKRQRIRNMEKLVYLEYGVKGRPATPVIKTAVIRAEPGVVQAMRKVFEQEVSGG